MDYTHGPGLIVVLLLGVVGGAWAKEWDSEDFQKEAGQTFNLRFHKYNHQIRPPQKQVGVTVHLTLRHVRGLDLDKGELQTVMDVDLAWYDSRLTWHAEHVHAIFVNVSKIWSPDIVYTNSVPPSESLYPRMVRIRKEGDEDNPNILWKKKELVTTTCTGQQGRGTVTCLINLAFLSRLAGGAGDSADRTFLVNDSQVNTAEELAHNRHWAVNAELLERDGNRSVSDQLTVRVSLTERKELTGSTLPAGHGDTTFNVAQLTQGNQTKHNSGRGVHSNGVLSTTVAMAMICYCHGALRALTR